MKCCVCGAESGRYPLCRACNQQKELGYIIKCPVCGQWHYGDEPCPKRVQVEFLYEPKKRLITKNEQGFFDALREIVPQGYHVFPQINLAAFLEKVDNSAYHNELFRNVDFLITDGEFAPKIVVEINDNTHHEWKRRQRDEKVSAICADAGIPLVTFWTNYGVNRPYIEKRIREALETPPQRVPSFTKENTAQRIHSRKKMPHGRRLIGMCRQNNTIKPIRENRDAILRLVCMARMIVRKFGRCGDIETSC